mmetsp:Transcript_9648/g.28225  ORF Transcript_9648/g.28225 Transcript_9648/m.28225 type:complete len:272 (+) Transcript_9648:381-1196(+)
MCSGSPSTTSRARSTSPSARAPTSTGCARRSTSCSGRCSRSGPRSRRCPRSSRTPQTRTAGGASRARTRAHTRWCRKSSPCRSASSQRPRRWSRRTCCCRRRRSSTASSRVSSHASLAPRSPNSCPSTSRPCGKRPRACRPWPRSSTCTRRRSTTISLTWKRPLGSSRSSNASTTSRNAGRRCTKSGNELPWRASRYITAARGHCKIWAETVYGPLPPAPPPAEPKSYHIYHCLVILSQPRRPPLSSRCCEHGSLRGRRRVPTVLRDRDSP